MLTLGVAPTHMLPLPRTQVTDTVHTGSHVVCSRRSPLGSVKTGKGNISETRLHLASDGTGAWVPKSLVFVFFCLCKRLVIFLALNVHMH